MLRKELRIITISLVVSFVLTVAKFAAYFLTHSVAILSDALESIINVVAGAFACYSIYLTGKPKDENHPYGHGKVEFFSIGFEGAMIFIAGILILFKAGQNIFLAKQIDDVRNGLWIEAATTLANLWLALYLKAAGKRMRSITISGNGQHIMTDVYSSGGLIAALLILQMTGWHWVDPAVSVVLGAIILVNGYKLLRRSVSGLMDETDMQLVDQLIAILNEHRRNAWIDVHNMRVQQYGNNYHVDCHVTLPYYLPLSDAHEEMKSLEHLVDKQLENHGEIEYFIHSDPCVPTSCKICQLAECPVRSFPFTGLLPWTRDNVLPNKKHGS